MGTGHIMRCLALAQAWQDAGGHAVFVAESLTAATKERLTAESCDVMAVSTPAGTAEDAQETIRMGDTLGARWIVVDGYHFNEDYQRTLKRAGFKVLFLDDYGHAKSYSADLVLNQNLSASENLYPNRGVETKLLLSPKYALLRREFSSWRTWTRVVRSDCRRLLVLMGGSDPANLTARVLEAVAGGDSDGFEMKVIVGGSNPHGPELECMAARSGAKIEFLTDVYNVSDLMAHSDVAISAAGSTCWELCMLGVPSLLIDVAENQTANAEELNRRHCAIHIGNRTVTAREIVNGLISLAGAESLRRSLSQNSRKLVDGNGSLRVLSAMTGATIVNARHANIEDKRLIWEWANDPEVRQASFSTEPIHWESHARWFTDKLADGDALLLIIETLDDEPIGQIRFDVCGRDADVHINLAKAKRGSGLAIPAIHAAMRILFSSRSCERVHAYVKPANAASVRVFEKAGFERLTSTTVKGNSALHFMRTRD